MEGGEQDPPTLLSWSCLLYCYFEYVHLSSTYLSLARKLDLYFAFYDSSVGKESTCNAGDPSSIPVSRRSAEGIGYPLQYSWASIVAWLVNNMPAMRETRVWFLGWEDPLEKGKVTHSSFLGWWIPWTVQSMGSQSQTQLTGFHFTFTFIRSLIVHLLDLRVPCLL